METIDYKHVGQRVKELRKEAGLTQEKLAEKCRISPNYISHIETAIGKPSTEILVRLASVFQVSLDYLLLDTLYVPSNIFIDGQINKQLEQCTPLTLRTVSKIIDTLLEQQSAMEKLTDTD